jgi:hypothetical protein
MATGLIVGESLMGVLYAGIVAAAEQAGSDNAGEVLALVEDFPAAIPLGILLFSALVAGLYWRTSRAALGAPALDDPHEPREAAIR